jgi:hypothetical protein
MAQADDLNSSIKVCMFDQYGTVVDMQIGLALLLYSDKCRCCRCISRGGAGRRRTDNGAPGLGPIYDPDYYTTFIIDPDGYRIEAYLRSRRDLK